MLLALDAGNSHIVIGVFDGDRLVTDGRLHSDPDRTADEVGVLLHGLLGHRGIEAVQITDSALCSVVPRLTDTLSEVARRYFACEPFVVGPQTDVGIPVRYEPRSDVGPDRLVNAVAAYAQYGGPAIVVDMGTATKFEAVAENGDYLGGAIAPGVGISTDALFRAGARLYRVPLTAPPRAIGANTIEAMQSGIVFGFAGQVDALVHRIRQEIGGAARVIATGGMAEVIRRESETIEIVDPTLTLKGLRLVWERNQQSAKP